MLGRRSKPPVLAELPARVGAGSRPGALGRTALSAYAGMVGSLEGTGSVLVTGPARAAVAAGLAAAATAAGGRVALLECDLAEPALAQLLALSPAPGLREYLLEDAEAAQILQPLVLVGPASGGATEPLNAIVAGAPEPEPVALIDSDRCDRAIQRLRKAYELLVLVGPGLSEDRDSLHALAEHARATLFAGGRAELPKRPPVDICGLVLVS